MSPCYIIDNGKDYSSHGIYFVDSEEPLDVLTALIKVAFNNGEAEVLGITKDISWLGGHPNTKLPEFLVNHAYYYYPDSLERCHDAAVETQNRVKELLRQHNPVPGHITSW